MIPKLGRTFLTSSSPHPLKGCRLQEHLSLCAKEHVQPTLSGTHSSSAQKKLLEFLCDPKKPRGPSFLQQLIHGELQMGLAEL